MTVLEDVNSLDTAADYLKLKRDFLIRLCRQKKIAHIRNGRTITFTREGLEVYRDTNVVAPLRANPFGLTDRSLQRSRAS